MITLRSLTCSLVAAAGLFTAGALYAAHDHDAMGHGDMAGAPAADKDAWLAKEKAAYPLDTCVVSGDELKPGEMGPPIDYVYKQEGKPDRLVRFCCKNCIKDFKKDPAKYLKKIDDAAAAKTGNEHAGHHM